MQPKDLTEEEFEEITWGDQYEEMTDERITDKRRWVSSVEQTFKKKDDGTYWDVMWEVGNTENQECDLNASIIEVEPVSETITIYKVKK